MNLVVHICWPWLELFTCHSAIMVPISVDLDILTTQDLRTPVCPNTIIKYSCSNTDFRPGSTMWVFPKGTCPHLNDTIILTRNAQDCIQTTQMCANSAALNENLFGDYCLTSSLLLKASSAALGINQILIQCFVMYDNSTDLESEGNATIFIVPVPGMISFTS